jgi:membrane protease YdiL (CAAX protease family)
VHLGPLARLFLWLVAVAATATTVQWAVQQLGWRSDLRDATGSGRFLLLLIAATGSVMLMGAERRPLHDFGVSISDNWAALLGSTFAAGVLACAVSYVAAFKAGNLALVEVPRVRWITGGITACLAFVIALLQEIIFRGYLLTLARDRFGAWTSVLATALLFALTIQMHANHLLLAPNRGLLVGSFLAGTLLALMRLYHGSLLAPVGIVTGWLFVDTVVRRTHVFIPATNFIAGPDWLCSPAGSCLAADPLRNPFAWCILIAGIFLYVVACMRNIGRLAQATSSGSSLPLSFKKFYPFCSFILLTPADILVPRLVQARFSIDARYLLRGIMTLATSVVNTAASLPERLLFPVLLRHRKVPDPLIIVGMHRSGTTHLHNLLALDPQFITPKTYQVMNPAGFLISGWAFVPLMWWVTPWKRPMDAMELSLFSPQEDEFAFASGGHLSPYWGVIFPRESAHYERYWLSDGFEADEKTAWKAQLMLFLRKLCVLSSARPLLKNPCHTGRVDMLLELFPGAKFVHLHRHPYTAYLSNIHLAREGLCLFQLQDRSFTTSEEDTLLDRYVAIEDRFYATVAQLPPVQVIDIRYEDLEVDPMGQIERIYDQLRINLTPAYRARLFSYLQSHASYQKNVLSAESDLRRREVNNKLAPLFRRWGYPIH